MNDARSGRRLCICDMKVKFHLLTIFNGDSKIVKIRVKSYLCVYIVLNMKKASYLTFLAAATACAGATAQERPNIVLILADDLGIGDVNFFNEDGKIQTPNIDALCRSGVSFTDAHATSALSTPSRYSVMTGRYPWRSSLKQSAIEGFHPSILADGRSTMANMLSDMGYNTACIGKWHLGIDWQRNADGSVNLFSPVGGSPVEHGFDYFFGLSASLDMAPYIFIENKQVTEKETREFPKGKGVLLLHGGVGGKEFKTEECLPEITRRALNFIGQQSSEKPFFLYFPLTAPHTPILPSPEFQGKSGIGPYGDFVMMVDDVVGQIVKKVEQTVGLDNTIIIFASDNGCAPYADTKGMEALGHYPSIHYKGYKADIYEGGHRIPFTLSWKGHYQPAVSSELVTLADIYSTIAQITGHRLYVNEAEDSFSLVDILEGREAPNRAAVVVTSGNGWFSIRSERYKLIFTAGSGGWLKPSTPEECVGLPPMQLYDIINDPSETTNLIEDPQYKNLIQSMTEKMHDYLVSGRTNLGPIQTNDTKNSWRQTKLFD